jgi:hypothetical protein
VYTDEFHSETGGFNFNFPHGNIWSNDSADTAVLYDAKGNEVSRRSYIIEEENEDLPPVYIARGNTKVHPIQYRMTVRAVSKVLNMMNMLSSATGVTVFRI